MKHTELNDRQTRAGNFRAGFCRGLLSALGLLLPVNVITVGNIAIYCEITEEDLRIYGRGKPIPAEILSQYR